MFIAVLTGLVLPLGNACSKMTLSQEILNSQGFSDGDEFFKLQWNLYNYGQTGGTSGEDANILPVWQDGNYGKDVFVAIIDDGLEIAHPDIKDNVAAGKSYNYQKNSTDPTSSEALHGTCVSGIIAGKAFNGIGIAGIAPEAQIAAYSFLESTTTSTETDAMTRNKELVGPSNNSWGPGPQGYGLFRPSSAAWRSAIETGLTTGRGGKGTIYIFAAGNGAIAPTGELGDNSNLNGYANFYGVTSICSVDEKGQVAVYSEPGANLWVCAPSGSGITNRPAITTTDITGATDGYNITSSSTDMSNKAYTKSFSGTSAAAPVISGVVALMLNERPELTWRDVKWILARTARKNDPTNQYWAQNGASPAFNIHYDYGFGTVDAEAAVSLARSWTLVGPLETYSSATTNSGQIIQDDGTKVSSSVTVSGSNISKIEYVEVTLNSIHDDWGNLVVDLKRTGAYTTTSRLAINHKCLNADTEAEEACAVNTSTFRFGTARHLGEAADGTWTLEVYDGKGLAGTQDSKVGTFTSWQMRIFGE